MARSREFDPDRALEAAMCVFWEKGYADTSVEDLVQATGVNRYGLYDVFESKRGLFLAALDRYRRTVIKEAIRELEDEGAGVEAIHAAFDRLVDRVRLGEARFGCLMCNAAEEVAPFDRDVAREVRAHQQRLTRAFRRALEVARERGEVPRGLDPGEVGSFLSGLIQGASFLARSPAGADAIADFVHVGLRVLD